MLSLDWHSPHRPASILSGITVFSFPEPQILSRMLSALSASWMLHRWGDRVLRSCPGGVRVRLGLPLSVSAVVQCS